MRSQPYTVAGRRGIAAASQEGGENQWRGIRERCWRVGFIWSARLHNLSPVLGATPRTTLQLTADPQWKSGVLPVESQAANCIRQSGYF